MALQYVVMGDIIGSRKYDPQKLRDEFLGILSLCNKEMKQGIVSPYTSTLGDEFQGIATSLAAAVESIFFLEEAILSWRLDFKLRYVTWLGDVDTTIRHRSAHTMMGEGLTQARRMLTDKQRATPRFRFHCNDTYTMEQLSRLFLVVDGLTNRWDIGDGKLILDMLGNTHNQLVGAAHGKNRSQIWKRRKNLLIEEYRALKEAIVDLAEKA